MRNGLPHLVVFVLLTFGCAAPSVRAASANTPAVNGGNYVEIASVLRTDAQYESWYALRTALERDFDETCGDTFCEGDYSNIESLRYQCSVHRFTGRIGQCAWTFAASDDSVDPRSGRIVSQGKIWQCVTPLSPGTTLEQLLAALSVAHPLYAHLPASSRTIYDGLSDCL